MKLLAGALVLLAAASAILCFVIVCDWAAASIAAKIIICNLNFAIGLSDRWVTGAQGFQYHIQHMVMAICTIVSAVQFYFVGRLYSKAILEDKFVVFFSALTLLVCAVTGAVVVQRALF